MLRIAVNFCVRSHLVFGTEMHGWMEVAELGTVQNGLEITFIVLILYCCIIIMEEGVL